MFSVTALGADSSPPPSAASKVVIRGTAVKSLALLLHMELRLKGASGSSCAVVDVGWKARCNGKAASPEMTYRQELSLTLYFLLVKSRSDFFASLDTGLLSKTDGQSKAFRSYAPIQPNACH